MTKQDSVLLAEKTVKKYEDRIRYYIDKGNAGAAARVRDNKEYRLAKALLDSQKRLNE